MNSEQKEARVATILWAFCEGGQPHGFTEDQETRRRFFNEQPKISWRLDLL
jgi:hypothetical protein